MDLGPQELLIILVIVLLLFGGAKLPQLAKSLGEAQREFRRGTKGEKEDAPASSQASSAVVDTTGTAAPATTEATPAPDTAATTDAP